MERLELRMHNSDLTVNEEEMIVEGLVNKTEAWSHTLGQRKKFKEKIEKGAFTRAIDNSDRIDFLGEHRSDMLLATTENGSLELWEDEEGLKMRAKIAPTTYGKDLFVLMKNKMVNHMSFGFRSISDKWKKLADGTYERSIGELMLKEVSVVRNPAYPQSAIAARGIDLIEDVEIPADLDVEERNDETPQEQPIAEVPVATTENVIVEQNVQPTTGLNVEQVVEMFSQFKNELLESLKSQKNEVPAVQTVENIPLAEEKPTVQNVENNVAKVEPETKQEIQTEQKPEVIDNSKGVVDLLTKYKELQSFK